MHYLFQKESENENQSTTGAIKLILNKVEFRELAKRIMFLHLNLLT